MFGSMLRICIRVLEQLNKDVDVDHLLWSSAVEVMKLEPHIKYRAEVDCGSSRYYVLYYL